MKHERKKSPPTFCFAALDWTRGCPAPSSGGLGCPWRMPPRCSSPTSRHTKHSTCEGAETPDQRGEKLPACRATRASWTPDGTALERGVPNIPVSCDLLESPPASPRSPQLDHCLVSVSPSPPKCALCHHVSLQPDPSAAPRSCNKQAASTPTINMQRKKETARRREQKLSFVSASQLTHQ